MTEIFELKMAKKCSFRVKTYFLYANIAPMLDWNELFLFNWLTAH